MAFENLFIRTRNSLAGVELDGVLSEDHDNEIDVTDNPVQLGADITDNAIIIPKRLIIEAMLTDTPLGAAAFGELIDNVTGLFGTSTAQNLTRTQAGYQQLIDIMNLRELITVQTKLVSYSNMIITNIRTKQDKTYTNSALLEIRIREIIITETQLVPVSRDNLEPGPTEEQASPPDRAGRKEAVIPDADTQQSVLKTISDWLF